MNIIVDAHGGDNAPIEVIKGAALAIKEYGINVTLCGKHQDIMSAVEASGVPISSLEGIKIVTAGLAMPVEAEPSEVLKRYSESSMAVGLRLLADGRGDAFVTAGSTGAAVVGASFILKRLKGIKRAAIATVIPCSNGVYLLIDAGANAECRPEMLQQFGIMGSVYMNKVYGIESPRVGMVNIGAEENKGTSLQIEAAKLLQQSPVSFIGNVEARDLPLGGCDVAVCDGFTGNVVLKLTEGMGKWFTSELKSIFMGSAGGKLAALMIKNGVTRFRKSIDYSEHGGAPLLGLRAPVIKAHGSSDALAFKNAIRQAKLMVENSVVETVSDALDSLRVKDGEKEDENE